MGICPRCTLLDDLPVSSFATLSAERAKMTGQGALSSRASQGLESPAADPSVEWVLVLEAGRAERHYWRDLWQYRELFAILAWRDVAVRYKQTVIGVAWAVVRP